MTRLVGKFIWFEHVSNDVARAHAFYGELLGWKSDPVPMGDQPYPMITNAGEGIGGFREAWPGAPNHWMSYLSVADVDASVEQAAAAGATVLMPPTDFGEVGRGATLADPAGAAFSLWTGSGDDPADRERVPVGGWYWNECMSTDAKKALAFYEQAFGFTHDTMQTVPGGYHVLLKDGVARAGLMQSPAPGPSFWLPYVAVADCDASLQKAKSLGARVTQEPMEIADVGRFGVISDPLGATLGLIRGKFTAA
jgi:hypothetical protein